METQRKQVKVGTFLRRLVGAATSIASACRSLSHCCRFCRLVFCGLSQPVVSRLKVRFSSFLPQSKDAHLRPSGSSTLAVGVIVSSGCYSSQWWSVSLSWLYAGPARNWTLLLQDDLDALLDVKPFGSNLAAVPVFSGPSSISRCSCDSRCVGGPTGAGVCLTASIVTSGRRAKTLRTLPWWLPALPLFRSLH